MIGLFKPKIDDGCTYCALCFGYDIINNKTVVIFHPCDNEHSIFVMEVDNFSDKFTPLSQSPQQQPET